MSTFTSPSPATFSLHSHRVWRALMGGGAILLFLVTLVGLLHMPIARPLLMKLGFGCPVTRASPEVIDRARSIPAAAYANKPVAPTRPVLGFAFEQTTLADVNQWAAQHGIACEKLNRNETLRACQNVPAEALGEPPWFAPAEEVDFEFRASGTLAVLTVLRRHLSMGRSIPMTAEISKRLRASVGEPETSAGENAPAHFAKGPLQSFQEDYAFANYAATLTETRLADSGILLREQYFSPVP